MGVCTPTLEGLNLAAFEALAALAILVVAAHNQSTSGSAASDSLAFKGLKGKSAS